MALEQVPVPSVPLNVHNIMLKSVIPVIHCGKSRNFAPLNSYDVAQ